MHLVSSIMSPRLNVYPSTLLKSMKKERSWRPLMGKRISSFINQFSESGPQVHFAILSRDGSAHLPWWFSSPCYHRRGGIVDHFDPVSSLCQTVACPKCSGRSRLTLELTGLARSAQGRDYEAYFTRSKKPQKPRSLPNPVERIVSWTFSRYIITSFHPRLDGSCPSVERDRQLLSVYYVLIFPSINGTTCLIKILICSNSSAIGHK